MNNFTGKTLGIIHATSLTVATVKPFVAEHLPGVTVLNFADDSIQKTNLEQKVGVIPKTNYFKFVQYAYNLEQAGADLIMLACSTFNYAVELARPMINTPLLQIDRPMMDLAVAQGKKIGVLATLPSTVPSTERLLRQAAADAGAGEIEVHTVLNTEAFPYYQKGEIEKHDEILIKEIEALAKTSDAVILAQLSMSSLAARVAGIGVPVYTSGQTGFAYAAKLLSE
jgi:aspartate/glutamate racemase